MSGFFNRINLMISRYLSNRLFMRDQLMLLSVMSCMIAVSALSSAFINLFLYSMAGSGINGADGIAAVAGYNLIVGIISFFSCFLIGIIAKRITYRVSMMIGVILHLVFYAIVIVVNKNILNYIFLVALFYGLGTTFFYLSYYSLMNIAITGLAKKQYVMFQGIISAFCGIVLPIAAGGVIAAFYKNTVGYMSVFFLCLFLCIVSIFLVAKMEKVRGQSRQTHFANVFIKSIKVKKYFAVSMCDVLRGLKEGIVSFFIPIMIYQLSKNIFVVGAYLATCAIFNILGSFLAQNRSISRHPIFWMFISIFVQFAVLCVMIFKINVLTIFIFGMVTALLTPMHITPLFMTYYKVLESLGTSVYKRDLETASVKEIYFNLGRVLAVAVGVAVIKSTIVTIGVLAVLFAIQVIGCIVSVAIKTQQDSEIENAD